jgi:hypothetical protein
MNDQIYLLLCQVATSIRRPSLESGDATLALEGVANSAAFLAAEVHQHGDVSLGQLAAYATALRKAALKVEQKISNLEAIEDLPEEALAEDFVDHAQNPEYVASVLEQAAELMRDGDSGTARGLVHLIAGAFKIHKTRQDERDSLNDDENAMSSVSRRE